MKKLVAFLVKWLMRTGDPRDHGLSDFDKMRGELKPCDVLLVEGRSRADRVIQMISLCPWSHAALYIGRPLDIADPDLKTIIGHFFNGTPDTPLVAESILGQGIILRPLQVYENDHLRICRPKSLSDKDAEQVTRFAISRLGAYKEGQYLFDLLRFFLPWSLFPHGWRGPLFRRWAGRHTKNKTCAFVAECLGFIQFPIYPLVKTTNAQGVQLLRRHPKLCLPFEIDRSPNFEIIKYPFIDFNPHENQRLIPWKGSGVFSGVDQDPVLSHQPPQNPTDSTAKDGVKNVTSIKSRLE